MTIKLVNSNTWGSITSLISLRESAFHGFDYRVFGAILNMRETTVGEVLYRL